MNHVYNHVIRQDLMTSILNFIIFPMFPPYGIVVYQLVNYASSYSGNRHYPHRNTGSMEMYNLCNYFVKSGVPEFMCILFFVSPLTSYINELLSE